MSFRTTTKEITEKPRQTLNAVLRVGIMNRSTMRTSADNTVDMTAASQDDAYALLHAPLGMVMAVVQQNGMALRYASPQMKNNEEVVMAAVQQNGMALMYASIEMKNNMDVVMAAVQQNGHALVYAPERIRNLMGA
jgi:hypothetical protein